MLEPHPVPPVSAESVGGRVLAYLRALSRHLVSLITSSGAAAAAIICEKVFGVPIPGGLFAAIFLGCGAVVAGFKAWEEERKAREEEHLSREAEAARALRLEDALNTKPAGPRLRLGFDPDDPLCGSKRGDDTVRVQVWNDGDRRADNVRVVLHAMEPPNPSLLLQAFPEMKTGKDTFSVSPSPDRPAVYVNVLFQQQHAAHGHTQILRLEHAKWLSPDTDRLTLVLRLDANSPSNLFELFFVAGESHRFQPHART